MYPARKRHYIKNKIESVLKMLNDSVLSDPQNLSHLFNIQRSSTTKKVSNTSWPLACYITLELTVRLLCCRSRLIFLSFYICVLQHTDIIFSPFCLNGRLNSPSLQSANIKIDTAGQSFFFQFRLTLQISRSSPISECYSVVNVA